MMIEIIVYTIISNFVFYSYGHLLKYQKFSNKIENINDRSILGCIFLSFIALILNFFIPLSKEINTLLLIISLIIFYFKRKNKIKKKEAFYLILTSLITSSLLLYSNVNRPDAGLYHLPYISYLNENKIIFGLTNIHFRFGAISILQYLSAINNNFIFDDIGIVIPLSSLVTFFIIYFFNNVLKIIKNTEKISISNIFSLFIVIFITYKINRYSSFGNDALAHLTLFYLLSKILSNNKLDFAFISVISVFAFLNKSTLIVSLIIPIYFFLKNINLRKFKIFYSFSSFFLLLWIIKNIFVSGCLVYPVEKTCFKNLKWVDLEEVKTQNISGEAWSKDWPNRSDKIISIEEYNKDFNWFNSWSKKHGILIFNIIFPYFLFCFIIFYLIKKKQTSEEVIVLNKNYNLYFLIFFASVGSFLFFIKFPLYRYGYSYLISLYILILNLFLIKLDKLSLIKTSKIILILCIIIFLGKQFQRYIRYNDTDFIWPRIYSFETNQKIISKKIDFKNNFYIYKTDGDLCMYSRSPCTNYSIKNNLFIEKKFNYMFINYKK